MEALAGRRRCGRCAVPGRPRQRGSEGSVDGVAARRRSVRSSATWFARATAPAVALRDVRLEDRYLRDHTLGRSISSAEPPRSPRCLVMPLTMSMEILAEAAMVLVPGPRLVGMRDVRAYRWLTLQGEKLTLRGVATRVRARRTARSRSRSSRRTAARCLGTAAHRRGVGSGARGRVSRGPVVGALALTSERPSKWAPERLYEDMMFHGPAFRGVLVSDGPWGRTAPRPTLQVMARGGPLPFDGHAALATDPGADGPAGPGRRFLDRRST
jgi:hypothetical protein